MTVTLGVVRGDSLVFEVEFFTDAEGTVPWDDVGDFDPRLQFRTSTKRTTDDPAAEPSVSVADNVVTFALSNDETADLGCSRTYYWDVQFTDPDAEPGMGDFTWPGDDEDRNRLTVTADATQVESGS